MVAKLAPRKEAVLRIIVREYIAKAIPVASEVIYRNYRLGVSPATIRNDMAYLGEEGYIIRPHTSAGGIPSDKGYRYYVESLSGEDIELPLDEQCFIRGLFYEADREFERWVKLATTLLAGLVQNAAVITFPRVAQCRFRHLELIAVHEFLTLMVLVLSGAILKRQLLSFDEPVTQEQLTSFANKLNAGYAGLSNSEILSRSRKLGLSPREQQVAGVVADVMSAEDEMEYDEPYLDGLRFMLNQPEFGQSDRMLGIMELMEGKDRLKPIFRHELAEEGVHVMIGEENQETVLRDLSLVSSRYGVPYGIGGDIGVIGPTRMDYGRTISTVRYLALVLSELFAGVYRDG